MGEVLSAKAISDRLHQAENSHESFTIRMVELAHQEAAPAFNRYLGDAELELSGVHDADSIEGRVSGKGRLILGDYSSQDPASIRFSTQGNVVSSVSVDGIFSIRGWSLGVLASLDVKSNGFRVKVDLTFRKTEGGSDASEMLMHLAAETLPNGEELRLSIDWVPWAEGFSVNGLLERIGVSLEDVGIPGDIVPKAPTVSFVHENDRWALSMSPRGKECGFFIVALS